MKVDVKCGNGKLVRDGRIRESFFQNLKLRIQLSLLIFPWSGGKPSHELCDPMLKTGNQCDDG
jgi:hypothetical protein